MKVKEYLLDSAPRIPNSEEYWKRKGKTGKEVCLVFHDDMDGIVSAVIIKKHLIAHGFKIKKYGVINYQEGWQAFQIDSKLITIAVDFADNIPGVDVYIDHHGRFSEDLIRTQKTYAIKTTTGSAAEGIAQQLGVPFSNDTKDWIDMIDSAKYVEYDIDIKCILDFDLKEIVKSKNAKLRFAATMNQLLKRSDHRTFIEVTNACPDASIYNIFRLFKIFYPRNNPNFRSGDEPEFVEDAKLRLDKMKKRTRGELLYRQGYDQGKKIIFNDQNDFWNSFANNLPNPDENGDLVNPDDPNSPENFKWQLKPGVYQIIGNLMYVPSGTWANPPRAKAIYYQDIESGVIPDDPKRNFVVIQYGNTLQIADLRPMKSVNQEYLPKDKNGNTITDLGKYCSNLVKNFETHLDYQDERTVSGGHWGIGTISNIFGKCKKKNYEGVKFLDLFKNKIINDLSGVKWGLTMPWNEIELKKVIKPDEVNKKLVDIDDIRSENEALTERNEREILAYLIINNINDYKLLSYFKDDTMKKIYEIWLDTKFYEISKKILIDSELEKIYFKVDKPTSIESSDLFNRIVKKFNLTDIYNPQAYVIRDRHRKELKRIFKIMFNIMRNDPLYVKPDTIGKYNKWIK